MHLQKKLLFLSCIINIHGLKVSKNLHKPENLNFSSNAGYKSKHITTDYLTVTKSLLSEELFEAETHHTMHIKYHTKISMSIKPGDSVIQALQSVLAQYDINIMFLSSAQDSIALSYIAQDKSIFEIIEELCKIMCWQLNFDGETIMIKKDTPFLYTHHISVINLSGSSNTHTSIKTESSKTETSTVISTRSWEEIERYLQFITGEEMTTNIHINLIEMQEQHTSNDTTIQEFDEFSFIQEQDYNALIPKQEKAPVIKPASTTPVKSSTSRFIINREAGLITLYGTQTMHKILAKFLYQFEAKMNMQVRFEGKIFAITLNDAHKLGIDLTQTLKIPFNILKQASNSAKELLTKISEHTFESTDPLTGKTASYQLNVEHIIDALSSYGTVHTLSTPELTIANNQIGIFKYTTNEVYFRTITKFHKDPQTNLAIENSRVEEPTLIPTGFTLSMQPSIDKVNGHIYVHVKQIIADVDSYKQSGIKDSNQKYPVLSYKEFDTKLRMRPSQWVVLGGYIIKRKEKDSGYGFPWFKHISQEEREEILCILRAFPVRANIMSLSERNMRIYMSNTA